MESKQFWQSKTLWLNTFTVLVAILMLVQARPWVATLPLLEESLLLVVGILNILLRFVTSQPVRVFTSED